jgi:arylsulfatase A-like enzyme
MTSSSRPNLIWLFGDQHRFHATGFAGDRNLYTPNIDDLALTGFTPTRGGVAGNSLCCPFRGSLLTGLYPHHCIPVHEAAMPKGQRTVAHAFGEADYHTAWIGKWHVDGFRESEGRAAFHVVPPERRGGFHKWIGYENNNSQFDCWVHGGEDEDRAPWKLEGFDTDALTDLFIAHLEERAEVPDRPFFAALSVQPPHWPMQCPAEYRTLRPDEVTLRPNVPLGGMAERGARLGAPGYCGMIENWDYNIGRVVTALRRLGLSNNTHIVFFADHGEMLGSHGRFGKVLPYEESIRTPLILGGADFFYNGLRSEHAVTMGGPPPPGLDVVINHADIAPTSLGLCGIPVPDWMEGFDYSFLRRGEPEPDGVPDGTLLQAIEPREQSPAYRGMVTRDGWKYCCTAEGPWLLFDLNNDPYEMNNLALVPRHRPDLLKLHQRLSALLVALGDSFALPSNSAIRP